MRKHATPAIEHLRGLNVPHEEISETIRLFAGHRGHRMFEEQLARENGTKRKADGEKARRKRVHRLWQQLRSDINLKRLHTEEALKSRPAAEHEYFDALRTVLEKVDARIAKHHKQATMGDKPTFETPTQVGHRLALPNSGLNWPDWVPPQIKDAINVLAEEVHAMRPHKAKPPTPFNPPKRSADEQRKTILRASLENQITASEMLIDAICPTGMPVELRDKRRLLALTAEIVAARQALQLLVTWPRTRPVPVSPMHVLGMTTERIQTEIGFIPNEQVEVLPADKYYQTASAAIERVRAAMGNKESNKYVSKEAQDEHKRSLAEFRKALLTPPPEEK